MTNKRILTQADVDYLKEALKRAFPTKQDFKNFKGEIFEKIDEQEDKFEKKLTKFKSEFFEKVDPILKEVTTAREERTLLENRLEALEEIHPKGKHTFTS